MLPLFFVKSAYNHIHKFNEHPSSIMQLTQL